MVIVVGLAVVLARSEVPLQKIKVQPVAAVAVRVTDVPLE